MLQCQRWALRNGEGPPIVSCVTWCIFSDFKCLYIAPWYVISCSSSAYCMFSHVPWCAFSQNWCITQAGCGEWESKWGGTILSMTCLKRQKSLLWWYGINRSAGGKHKGPEVLTSTVWFDSSCGSHITLVTPMFVDSYKILWNWCFEVFNTLLSRLYSGEEMSNNCWLRASCCSL